MTAVRTRLTDDDLLPVLLFAVLAAFACLLPAQNDTFLHLRSGLHMWETGAFIVTEPFSHTAYGAELHNHWWLTQLLFYATYTAGGPFLLTALAGALALGAVAGAWRLTRGPWELRVGLLAWLAVATAPSWSIRPQVLSLALLVLTLHLVVRNRLAWLPLVCAVWANAHGLVIFGVGVSLAALVEAVLWSRRDLGRSALIAAACVAAPMASPLGWSYWPQILSTVSMAGELQIDEYRMPLGLGDLPFWAMVAALAYGVVHQRRRWLDMAQADRILVLCALGLAAAGMSASRNVAFFAVAAAPALSRLWPPTAVRTRRAQPMGVPALVLCLALVAVEVVVVAGRWRNAGAALGWTPVPAGALVALHGCPDPLFNEMKDGGYLIWALADRRVFVDGRMEAYPLEVLRASRQADIVGDYEDTFRQYGINCALVTTGSRLGARLARDPGLTLAYQDADRSVFVRSAPSLAAR